MAEQDLIDSIVSNEALGIKKKPSIFKIILVLVIVVVAALTSYSFYIKTKKDDVIPPLSLGESVKPIGSPSPVEPVITMPPAIATTVEPVVAPAVAAEVKTPVANLAAVEQAQPVTTVATQPITQAPNNVVVAVAPVADKSLPITPKPSIQAVTAQVSPLIAESTLTNNEVVVKPTPIKKPKLALHKKQVKKIVEKVTQEAKADEYTPRAPVVEEGVTREEIIVFQ